MITPLQEKQFRDAVRAILRNLDLPTGVRVGGYLFSVDMELKPVLRVWIVIDDALGTEEWLDEHILPIRNQIHDQLIQQGIEHWPLVRFETISEWNAEPFQGETL